MKEMLEKLLQEVVDSLMERDFEYTEMQRYPNEEFSLRFNGAILFVSKQEDTTKISSGHVSISVSVEVYEKITNLYFQDRDEKLEAELSSALA